VRKSENWVIGVIVGWSPGYKLLRMTLVLCEIVFSLLQRSAGALEAPWRGSPVSLETVFAAG